ncbi:MAG: class I SAM-dependent methyltransferase [Nanoarchaeota archaeon]|nr:class I SAM-dependent methyltransferase [Nanoarchaeota archaeon]MBU1320869.1 class I SAM-dependent methyltransferase [Nanoarchaeota archaeon]MBU1597775.1 class I SAM-dependent methyltransferase [Nanoarchaeota archaeon]MBU2441226.1 class I SAM-dependent methyltransferase [Nanoarchaeota archaeon]
MKTLSFRRDTCRLCGGKNLESVIKFENTPIGDAYVTEEHLDKKQEVFPVEVFLCRDCGHAQLLDVVDSEAIYREYLYKTSISLGLVEHFRKGVDSILDYVKPEKGAFVVDIGSNDGSVLQAFKNKGMRVLGVDPAKEIAKKATEKGIKTIPEIFNLKLAKDINNKYGQAQIIITNNTFANIDDLDDVMAGIKEILAPNGVFVVETGYALDLLQKIVFDNIYHEHLSYFSVKPFQSFFKKHGMELINVKRVPTKAGSIRCFVQFAGGPRKLLPSVERIISLETDMGLHEPQIFKDFVSNFNSMKEQTVNLLKRLKAKGKKIVGYCASVGVTTLLYNFGINQDLIECLVDDSPSKHNLYSPGFHVPVLSPKKIYEIKPDYVIILAWQYNKPIIKKHLEYLAEGGCFIVFLPLLKVIDCESFENV